MNVWLVFHSKPIQMSAETFIAVSESTAYKSIADANPNTRFCNKLYSKVPDCHMLCQALITTD